MKRKICFLTLAKGNSKRFKNKNIAMFSGKPLIHWTILKIRKITKNYYINTDSKFIEDYAKKFKIRTIFRKKSLQGDDIPARHLMLDSFKYFPKNTYAVITVQANSPNLDISKLLYAYDILKNTNIEDIRSIKKNREINGSFWGITLRKLKTYNFDKKKHDHKSLKNECWIVDDSIDIHNIKDLKSAEKKFSKRKLC